MRRYRKFPDFEIFQYVFSQKVFCALSTLLLRPLITITHAIFGFKTSALMAPGKAVFPDKEFHIENKQKSLYHIIKSHR